MSEIQSNLKQWGAQGSQYPDGYSYLEGEQPVDEWDNYFAYNTVAEIHELQSVMNDRLESDAGSSHPNSPEVGHLSHRTDSPGDSSGDELYFYDSSDSEWERVFKAGGDTMEGPLDMGGYAIKNFRNLTANNDSADIETSGSGSGRIGIKDAANDRFGVKVDEGELTDVDEATVGYEWFSKQEGGTVSYGTVVPIGSFTLDDAARLEITQAMLTEDGLSTPAQSGIDLVVVPEGAADSTDTTTILSGDGSTFYGHETGNPHTVYENTSGGAQTVMVGIDNGSYNSGAGDDYPVFAGYIARIKQ